MAEIPTVRVVRLEDDHEMTINVSRYEADPDAYRLVGDEPEEPEPEPDPPQGGDDEGEITFEDILAGTVPEVREFVEASTSVEDLEELSFLETFDDSDSEAFGKNRKGVIEAINERLAELEKYHHFTTSSGRKVSAVKRYSARAEAAATDGSLADDTELG